MLQAALSKAYFTFKVCMYVYVGYYFFVIRFSWWNTHSANMQEPQYNGTHYSEHLSIANATKAIVARAIETKKRKLILQIILRDVFFNGFHL